MEKEIINLVNRNYSHKMRFQQRYNPQQNKQFIRRQHARRWSSTSNNKEMMRSSKQRLRFKKRELNDLLLIAHLTLRGNTVIFLIRLTRIFRTQIEDLQTRMKCNEDSRDRLTSQLRTTENSIEPTKKSLEKANGQLVQMKEDHLNAVTALRAEADKLR